MLPWTEIEAVFGYKKDCYTVDQMRLLILGATGGVEYFESDDDFTGLCFALAAELGLTHPLYLELFARPSCDETRVQFYPELKDGEVGSIVSRKS